MKLIYWAIIGIGIFIAVWMLFVVPAERRYHERKLEIIRKQLEKRQSSTTGQGDDMAAGTDEQGES